MKILKSIRLTFTQGSSDKEYRIQLVEKEDGHYVHMQNGRRNGTLTPRVKSETPSSLAVAEKMYDNILKEKLKDGYTPDGESPLTMVVEVKSQDATQVQLLNEVSDENHLEELLNDDNYVMQQKMDGERRTIDKKNKKVSGGNKKGQTTSLPAEIEESLKKETDILLDSEIIGNICYVFDILRYDSKDLTKEPYSERLSILSKIKFGKNIQIVKTAFTKKEKLTLLNKLKKENAEGVVFKELSSEYNSGRSNKSKNNKFSALKYKFYKTATVKVFSITQGKRSVQMAVKEKNKFIEVGAVTIPSNQEIPKINEYIEVRYLYAYKGGSLFQPTFIVKRTDVDDSDAIIEQLSYKQEL